MTIHIVQSWRFKEPAINEMEEQRVRLLLHPEIQAGVVSFSRDKLGRLLIEGSNQDIVERIRGIGLAAGTPEEFVYHEIGPGILPD